MFHVSLLCFMLSLVRQSTQFHLPNKLFATATSRRSCTRINSNRNPILQQQHHKHKMSTGTGINTDGSLKKYPTPTPSTPASLAASTGDVPALSSSQVAPFLWKKDESGNFPLIWAADAGQAAALEYILSQSNDNGDSDEKVDINTRGYLGNTAISRAARGGHVACVKLLLAQTQNDNDSMNINPNIGNEKKQYPLHFAAFKKHPEVVRVLLDSGLCDTLVKDRKGRTPAEDTSVEMIRDMILEYRA